VNLGQSAHWLTDQVHLEQWSSSSTHSGREPLGISVTGFFMGLMSFLSRNHQHQSTDVSTSGLALSTTELKALMSQPVVWPYPPPNSRLKTLMSQPVVWPYPPPNSRLKARCWCPIQLIIIICMKKNTRSVGQFEKVLYISQHWQKFINVINTAAYT